MRVLSPVESVFTKKVGGPPVCSGGKSRSEGRREISSLLAGGNRRFGRAFLWSGGGWCRKSKLKEQLAQPGALFEVHIGHLEAHCLGAGAAHDGLHAQR